MAKCKHENCEIILNPEDIRTLYRFKVVKNVTLLVKSCSCGFIETAIVGAGIFGDLDTLVLKPKEKKKEQKTKWFFSETID